MKTLSLVLCCQGSKGGAVVRALASHQCGRGSNPGVDMWVEFVVGSLLCSERFFSGYSGFPLSPKTNTSKFQFDLERTDTEKRALKLLASWVNKLHLHLHLHFHFTDRCKMSLEHAPGAKALVCIGLNKLCLLFVCLFVCFLYKKETIWLLPAN